FDRYDDEFLVAPDVTERSADAVIQSAAAWIDANSSRPVFAWTHLSAPHSPYTPPAPFASAHHDAPYDGEVAYTDAAVGRFLDRLRQRQLFSPAAIVIVADHGEALGDHGERTHGTFLYDATIRVPLLIKLPTVRLKPDTTAAGSPVRLRPDTTPAGSPVATVDGSADAHARVVNVPVETADLAATIAAIAGASLARTDGQNLLPLLSGAAGDPDRPAYAESYYQNVLLGWSPLRAVRTSRWKLIEAPRPELYDLEHDAGETQNRAADRSALAAGLQHALTSLGDT